jgi:hypothetical protein
MMKMRIGVTRELYQITTKMKMSHVKRARELGRNQRHTRFATELWYLTNCCVILGFEAAFELGEVRRLSGTTFFPLLPEVAARSSESKQDHEIISG